MNYFYVLLVIICLLIGLPTTTFSQDISAKQFSNELRFSRSLAKRWAGELSFTNSFAPVPPATGLFGQYAQWSVGGWGHNYIASRWRLSGGLFLYKKIQTAEPPQDKSAEFRISGQVQYYIKNIGYTITSRSRVEWRNIEDSENEFQSVLRLREQVKLVVPINSKSIRKGVFYSFASDEVFFKTPSDISGDEFFDRNRFDIGVGYSITNDINVELYYANEFLPRDINEVNHIINVDFSFRNLISNLKKRFGTPAAIGTDD